MVHKKNTKLETFKQVERKIKRRKSQIPKLKDVVHIPQKNPKGQIVISIKKKILYGFGLTIKDLLNINLK